jgi:hypothetical protein
MEQEKHRDRAGIDTYNFVDVFVVKWLEQRAEEVASTSSGLGDARKQATLWLTH